MYTITLKAEIRDMTLEHPKLDLYIPKVLYKVNQLRLSISNLKQTTI